MKDLSQLIGAVPGSVTDDDEGRECAAGVDVINLAGGEPISTRRPTSSTPHKAMLAGDTHYPPSFGTPELLDAIVGKLAREQRPRHP
ncbi:MAG: hypothetical protein R2838_05755 [Caldilineaceae bacterium]